MRETSLEKTSKLKRPSMKDVAELVGVSRTTVSFVLNRRPDSNIPQITQDKVWAAAEELGYRPNALARGLRNQHTQTIGFISDEVGTTPYAGQILQGAQDFAWQNDYLLFSVNTGRNDKLKEAAVDALLERLVDGIIYAAMYHREVTPPPAIREVPTVLLDCTVRDHSLPSVVPDEVTGGRDAVLHLLEKGHQRIGFVCEERNTAAKIGRLQGYKEALAQYNIPFDPTLIYAGASSKQSGGYDCTMSLMTLDNRPTAIFYFNDRMAMGGYDALRKLNLSIPDDVAVVGFDDQQIIAADLYPALTTMRLPHYEMGQWAVEHLLNLFKSSGTDEPIQRQLPCPLIVRQST